MSVGSLNMVTDGLVLYVDAYNVKSYVSGDTVANDLSTTTGGTLTNGVGFDTNAWTFDGVSDYINFGNVLNQPSNDFTISAWVKLVDNGLSVSMIVSKRESAGAFNGYTLRVSSTGFPTLIYDGASSGPNRFSSQSIYDDAWHYIVGIYNLSGDVLDIYTDGILTNGSASSSPSAAGSISNTENFQIGSRGGDFWLEGSVGLVSMHDRALTAAEVLKNYNATKWRFE